jgi:hypothetical protein
MPQGGGENTSEPGSTNMHMLCALENDIRRIQDELHDQRCVIRDLSRVLFLFIIKDVKSKLD